MVPRLARQLSLAAIISTAASLSLVHKVFAYTFTQIADGDSLNSFFLFTEAVNDSGTVAFSAVSDNFLDFTIYRSDNGVLTPLASNSESLQFLESFDINNNGSILFYGERTDGSIGLFTISGSSVVTIADSNGPISNFGVFGIPVESTINDSGTVAFVANLDTGGQSLFAGSGSTLTTIADTTSLFTSFASDAFINSSGTIAFAANLSAGGQGIFTSSGGVLTSIVDSSGSFDLLGAPAINDNGALVFTAFPDAGELGIYTASNGVITSIVDSSGIFSGFNNPAINNNGVVAFQAGLDDFSEGIFVGADPLEDKVIATGDLLFGKTVVGVSFFNKGLNNSNQIAFFARFDDGSEGIFRADPEESVAVPEPTMVLGLLAVVTAGIGLKRGKLRFGVI